MHKFEKSTSVSYCDYDDKEGHLIVCFHNGGTYRYKCDKEEYEALCSAKSPGGHFASMIRPKYKHIT